MTLKDLAGRLVRWSMDLQVFQLKIEHRKGKDNVARANMLYCPLELEELNIFNFGTSGIRNGQRWCMRTKRSFQTFENSYKRAQFAWKDTVEFQWKL